MRKIILLVSVASMVCACHKNNCNERSVPIRHFDTDYGCQNSKRTLAVNLTNNCILIRSQAFYDTQVTGTCHPSIDFTRYDLLIGKQSSANRNDTILYDYKRTCPNEVLTLNVDIVQSAVTQPDNVVYNAIIPKLTDKDSLRIMVTIE